MFPHKYWISIFFGCCILLFAAGCQSTVDEEARAQIATLEANQEETQAALEALLSNQAAGETDAQFEMTLHTGLEVIHQDGESPQSTIFPIDRLTYYGDYLEFEEEWAVEGTEKNNSSRVHLAFLADPASDSWDLYYTTSVIPESVTWESPALRSHLVKAQWPANGQTNDESYSVPGAVSVELGSKQPINSAPEKFRSDGDSMQDTLDDKLGKVVEDNGGVLDDTDEIIFLIHDRSEGQDDFVLAVIDALADIAPDPNDDPPTSQYCSTCQGLWCRWRCGR